MTGATGRGTASGSSGRGVVYAAQDLPVGSEDRCVRPAVGPQVDLVDGRRVGVLHREGTSPGVSFKHARGATGTSSRPAASSATRGRGSPAWRPASRGRGRS